MITVGIATIPSRVNSLKRVLDSLTGQVDLMHVVLNGYDFLPDFLLKYKNIIYRIEDNEKVGDGMKFYLSEAVNGFHVSVDDDLCVRDGLIKEMVSKCNDYHAIVTLHGKRYDGERPIKSYRSSFTKNIHCLKDYTTDTEVHVGGTGIMVFNTDEFKLSVSNFEHKNMADVIVAREAHKQGIKIMALAHTVNDLTYIPPPKGTTIWETSRMDRIQTHILNSFIK